MTALAPTLQSFFTNYLIGQRAASAHTISAYRDTFRLLLNYTRQETASPPTGEPFSFRTVHAALIDMNDSYFSAGVR